MVTVLFADVVDSTGARRRFDAERARDPCIFRLSLHTPMAQGPVDCGVVARSKRPGASDARARGRVSSCRQAPAFGTRARERRVPLDPKCRQMPGPVTGGEVSAAAFQSRSQQAESLVQVRDPRVELAELPSSQRLPRSPSVQERADFLQGEAGALTQGDGPKTPNGALVVPTLPAGSPGRPDEADSIVVAQGGRRDPRSVHHLTDAHQIVHLCLLTWSELQVARYHRSQRRRSRWRRPGCQAS
jgi:hypothetical protein